jgi:hypothetical protein
MKRIGSIIMNFLNWISVPPIEPTPPPKENTPSEKEEENISPAQRELAWKIAKIIAAAPDGQYDGFLDRLPPEMRDEIEFLIPHAQARADEFLSFSDQVRAEIESQGLDPDVTMVDWERRHSLRKTGYDPGRYGGGTP